MSKIYKTSKAIIADGNVGAGHLLIAEVELKVGEIHRNQEC
jgi:hypothetical protein